MTFRQIGDDHYKQAGDAIDASRRNGAAYEGFDDADLVAAAAAFALQKGAPRLIASSYDTGADSYLEQGSAAWRPLHGAIARFVETYDKDIMSIHSKGEGVGSVVSDVLQRVSARKIVNAAGNRDLEPGLNDFQVKMAERARSDDGFRKDMQAVSVGDFHRLSQDMSESLGEVLQDPLAGRLGEEVSLMSRAVEGIVDRQERMMDNARLHDGALGLFNPVSDGSLNKVVSFHKDGTGTGDEIVDAAMTLLNKQGHVSGMLNPNDPMMIAQARFIEDGRSGFSQAPADLASMAVTDALIMTEARHRIEPTIEDDAIGQGEYHRLPDGKRETLDRSIVFGDRTSPLEKIQLEVGMLENSGIAAMDRAHFRSREEVEQDPTPDSIAADSDSGKKPSLQMRRAQQMAAFDGGMGM